MKKSSFTLVELLVVIGIIGVLAGMIMPALGGARATSVRTDCVNNRHQLGLAALQYAGDNKQHIPFLLKSYGKDVDEKKAASNANYAMILSGKTGRKKLTDKEIRIGGAIGYMPEDKILLCTEADMHFLYTSGANAVGMLDLSEKSDSWYTGKTKDDKDVIEVVGRFRSYKDKKTVSYNLMRMKDPANLIIFADTFISGAPSPNTYDRFSAGSKEGKGLITMIHKGTTVVGMADGSSRIMGPGELRDSSVEIETTLQEDLSHTTTTK